MRTRDVATRARSIPEMPMRHPEQQQLFDPDPLIDKEGAARCLGVEQRFIKRLVSEKRITYVKVGRKIRFPSIDDRGIHPRQHRKCTHVSSILPLIDSPSFNGTWTGRLRLCMDESAYYFAQGRLWMLCYRKHFSRADVGRSHFHSACGPPGRAG